MPNTFNRIAFYYYRKYRNLRNKNKRYRRTIKKLNKKLNEDLGGKNND